MVSLPSKILEDTNKFRYRCYGDGVAYSLTCKILQREIFVRDQSAVTVHHTFTTYREKHPGMQVDQILKKVWDRYSELSEPLLFEMCQGTDVEV